MLNHQRLTKVSARTHMAVPLVERLRTHTLLSLPYWEAVLHADRTGRFSIIVVHPILPDYYTHYNKNTCPEYVHAITLVIPI